MAAFVVADSSPLIGLATARAFHVLRDLYGTVTITRLVKDEVTGHPDRPGARELEAAMRAGWIRVAPAPPETWTFPTLDNGEASTLAHDMRHRLGSQRGAQVVLFPPAIFLESVAGRVRDSQLELGGDLVQAPPPAP